GMTNRPFKTGASRAQSCLLPPSVEDYVGPDNPVRAIDAFVAALDLARLGFRHAGSVGGGVGQPPYDPADLLKLYLYGYVHRVRSSRRLEHEARRNLELIWLLHGLTPGYRTIAKFRAENWAALKAANRSFVLLARELGLLGGTLVAIDGAFFDGNASKGSIATKKRLAAALAAIERDIEAYGTALDAADAAEAAPADRDDGGAGGGGDVGRKMAALMAKRDALKADLARQAESGETQVSRTDADARLLTKRGQTVAGYNVQIAVDDAHKLIVASEVVGDGNDTGQLHPMAVAAREALAVETLTVLADVGYFNGTMLKRCEDDGIVAYVPEAERTGRLAAQGCFSHADFTYDAAADVCRCPGGAVLTPIESLKQNAGRLERRYVSRKRVCDACPLRERCITAKSATRTICRWVHEDVLDRHRARMRGAGALMRRRAALAEHPFGTLKCRAGWRHFLVRGFDKVRGEWSLMALGYNFTRLLAILGLDRFVACLAERAAELLARSAPNAVQTLIRAAARLLARFAAEIASTEARRRPLSALQA
ncbi:IS1182 family transposase, partial [Rhodoplanes roseus]